MVSIMLLNISTIRGEWHPAAQFNDPDEDHPFHLIDGRDERATQMQYVRTVFQLIHHYLPSVPCQIKDKLFSF